MAGNLARPCGSWWLSKKGEKLFKETPDLTLGKKKYKADLIPPGLMVARYFADKQAHIDELQADLDGISQELEALIEEHSGEEGLLAEAQTDKGSVTKGSVSARLKEIKGDPECRGGAGDCWRNARSSMTRKRR
jgi:type I restriction enzyme M protein